MSADLGLAIHDLCSPPKNQKTYDQSKSAKIKHIHIMLMRHVQSEISDSSFDLRTGAIPNTKSYIKVLAAACISKQPTITLQSREFCDDFAEYMTKTQNKAKFTLNGFMQMKQSDSDMSNLIQSISFEVPLISRTLDIFNIHNLGRLHNGTLQKLSLPAAAVFTDKILPINLTIVKNISIQRCVAKVNFIIITF